jgi:hypothetical protein
MMMISTVLIRLEWETNAVSRCRLLECAPSGFVDNVLWKINLDGLLVNARRCDAQRVLVLLWTRNELDAKVLDA